MAGRAKGGARREVRTTPTGARDPVAKGTPGA